MDGIPYSKAINREVATLPEAPCTESNIASKHRNFPAIAIRLSLHGFGTQIGCRMLLRAFQMSRKFPVCLHQDVIY